MKIVKTILAIITLLTIIFFGTGLLVKETSYTATVAIKKPLKEVFTLFNNSENVKKWIPEIKSFNVIKENPNKIGSTYKIVINNKGQEITMTEKVLAFEDNKKITFFFKGDNMLKTDNYIFSTQNNNTIVTLNASCQSNSYILACLFPYFKGTFKEQDQKYLNNFKTFVESKSIDIFN